MRHIVNDISEHHRVEAAAENNVNECMAEGAGKHFGRWYSPKNRYVENAKGLVAILWRQWLTTSFRIAGMTPYFMTEGISRGSVSPVTTGKPAEVSNHENRGRGKGS